MQHLGQLFLPFALLAVAVGSARAQPAEPVEPAEQPAYQDRVLDTLTPVAGGLTADAAAATAVKVSPSVAATRGEISLSQAQSRKTGARYLPRLTLSAGVSRANRTDFNFGGGFTVGALNPGPLTVGACPAGGGDCVLDSAGQPVGAIEPEPFTIPRNTYRLDANLSVPLTDYLLSWPSSRRAANADADAARGRTDAQRAQADLEARISYYRWLEIRAQLAVAERALSSTRARLEDVKLALAAGTVAPADVLQIESAVATAEVAVSDATSYELAARQTLGLHMGTTQLDFEVGEDLRAPVEPVATLGTLEQLVRGAIAKRSEIRALRHSITAAGEAGKAARADGWPRLDGVASLTYANPNQQFFPPDNEWNASWTVGLTASWRFDGYAIASAQVDELEANRRIFVAQLSVAQRRIATEVTSAWHEWRRAEAALASTGKAMEAAEGAYAQRVMLYQGGEATTTEVIEAELVRHNATLQEIAARVELRIARARLLRAIEGEN